MNELYQITLITTRIVSGWLSANAGVVYSALGFLLGYASREIVPPFVITPVREQFQLIREIKEDFQDYARVCLPRRREDSDETQQTKGDEAVRILRKYSNKLRTSTEMIRGYCLFEFLQFVPKRERAKSAWKNLMVLSNSTYGGDPGKRKEICEKIEAALRY